MATIKPEDLSKAIKSRIDDATRSALGRWQKAASEMLKTEINEYLDAGKSPVENGGALKKYSASYKKRRVAKGQSTSPVQMRDTGEMRDSLRVTPSGLNAIKAYFSGRRNAELALIHSQFGAGKSGVIRKVLPFFGEGFNQVIKNKLRSLFKSMFRMKK